MILLLVGFFQGTSWMILFIGNKALCKVHMLACRKKHTYGPAYSSHSDNTNLPWLQLVMSPTQGEVSHQMTAPTKQNNPKIEPTNNMSDWAWITGCLIYCTTSFAVSNSSQEQNLAFLSRAYIAHMIFQNEGYQINLLKKRSKCYKYRTKMCLQHRGFNLRK
jgi:hypothetical protein